MELASVVSIGVQVIGFAIVIFKGGAFIGRVETKLEEIQNNQEKDAVAMVSHERDDNTRFKDVNIVLTDRFRDINSLISDVRVEVAKLTPKEN